MKRYKSKIERRYGENLMIKGDRNASPKAAFRRRPFAPGPAGKKKFRKTTSEFGRQLAEKQKLRISYGLNERQFKNLVNTALKSIGRNDVILMQLLERRLDNVIMRMGLADTRAQARQIVSHAHVLVNGKGNNIPSYTVKKGDMIAIKPRFKESVFMKNIQLKLKNHTAPSWVALDKAKIEAKIVTFPEGKEISINVDLPLVVEYYSR